MKRFSLVNRAAVLAALGVLLVLGMLWSGVSAQANPTVQIASHPQLGDILTGPDGMTLYTFANDEPGISNCTEGCAQNWPPLVSEGALVAPAGLPGVLGTLTRAPDEDTEERVTQVTYNGQPLYYWSRDAAVGDATGQGVGDLWFVARP